MPSVSQCLWVWPYSSRAAQAPDEGRGDSSRSHGDTEGIRKVGKQEGTGGAGVLSTPPSSGGSGRRGSSFLDAGQGVTCLILRCPA